MCLLDWLMVIPVSKLLSKTNEDENVTLLARVFQVRSFISTHVIFSYQMHNCSPYQKEYYVLLYASSAEQQHLSFL